MPNVKQIVERLIEAVPPPRVAHPRPQSSWAALKVCDVLRRPDTSRGLGDQVAGLWEVCDCNSAGVTLTYNGETIELSDRNWKAIGWHKLTKKELKEITDVRKNKGS